MASVSSLDQDMRNLRMSRYTPQAANEVRAWIETSLNEKLPAGDLLDALKDGVALCKLANLVLPAPGIRFKTSAMPFMQMENISHFLKACEMAPLNMPAHDRFLTVDLFESKDPAQVLQCLGAFSRQAHALQPSKFRSTIGPRKPGALSPAVSGSASGFSSNRPPSPVKASTPMPAAARALSPSLTGGSTGSQGTVSSWSRKTDEGVTTPAWNIAQYGYMGGASQGNQGISFGARRQITSQAPQVPSLAEKERMRREKSAEEERLRQQAEEAEHRRRTERDAEEERDRAQEQRRWQEETQRMREEERNRVEEQKRKWAEDERRWKEEDEARRKEEAEIKAALKPVPPLGGGNAVLKGQSLSQYQQEQAALASQAGGDEPEETPEQKRVRELEKQLEEARERERQYQAEREERMKQDVPKDRPRPESATVDRPNSSRDSEASWAPDEREYLRHQWQNSRESTPSKLSNHVNATRPLPLEPKPASPFARPLPQPKTQPSLPPRGPPPPSDPAQPGAGVERPLPVPTKDIDAYVPEQARPNRTDQFLSSNAAPRDVRPTVSSSQETGDSSLEQQQDRDRRLASQQKTKAGGWASKSLLEREMERERERQREWEANQTANKDVPRDQNEGSGPGQSWSTAQYGYIGGDNQGRGSSSGSGIDFGGRRQIVQPSSKPIGPRPQK